MCTLLVRVYCILLSHHPSVCCRGTSSLLHYLCSPNFIVIRNSIFVLDEKLCKVTSSEAVDSSSCHLTLCYQSTRRKRHQHLFGRRIGLQMRTRSSNQATLSQSRTYCIHSSIFLDNHCCSFLYKSLPVEN